MVDLGLRKEPRLVRQRLRNPDEGRQRHDGQIENLLSHTPVQRIVRIVGRVGKEHHL